MQPVQSATPVEPGQHSEVRWTTPPVQAAEPTQPVQPTQTVWPVQPQQPVQSYSPPASSHVGAPVERLLSVSATYRASQIVYLVLGVVEALMITRVVLKLLAASTSSGFVRFVYGASSPLIAPFRGIFPTPASNSSVLELSSLVAIAVYALVAWGIVRVVLILSRSQLPTTAG